MIGFFSIVGAIIWTVIEVVAKLTGKITVIGWVTSFIFNLLSFGVIMMTLGILGEYLWRIFDSARGRPPYIIEDQVDRKNMEDLKKGG